MFIDDDAELVYVYHTVRWDDQLQGDPFANAGRNAEDLGVEIFSPKPDFTVKFPIIDDARWKLDLNKGESSPCSYDKSKERYCVQLKVKISASDESAADVYPALKFFVGAESIDKNVVAFVDVYEVTRKMGVLREDGPVASLPLTLDGAELTTEYLKDFGGVEDRESFVVGVVRVEEGSLKNVNMAVKYNSVGL